MSKSRASATSRSEGSTATGPFEMDKEVAAFRLQLCSICIKNQTTIDKNLFCVNDGKVEIKQPVQTRK
jgi:hypothetical protein